METSHSGTVTTYLVTNCRCPRAFGLRAASQEQHQYEGWRGAANRDQSSGRQQADSSVISVGTGMRFHHRRVYAALRQSNFHPNPRAWSSRERTQVHFIYMWVKHSIDFYLSISLLVNKKTENPILGDWSPRHAIQNINISCLASVMHLFLSWMDPPAWYVGRSYHGEGGWG